MCQDDKEVNWTGVVPVIKDSTGEITGQATVGSGRFVQVEEEDQ